MLWLSPVNELSKRDLVNEPETSCDPKVIILFCINTFVFHCNAFILIVIVLQLKQTIFIQSKINTSGSYILLIINNPEIISVLEVIILFCINIACFNRNTFIYLLMTIAGVCGGNIQIFCICYHCLIKILIPIWIFMC